MTKRICLIAVVLALGAGVFALETSTHIPSGWWRGEAFYRGRPTSYWSKEVRHWRPLFT
jgi:hypothetical protein